MTVCNEWKTEKCHECTNMGKLKDSNYDGNCASRHCLSGTYEISRRLIFVEQSVQSINYILGIASIILVFKKLWGTVFPSLISFPFILP